MGAIDISENNLSQDDTVIQLGFPPNRIDLITGLSGLKFDECYDNRKILHDQEGNELPFLGFNDLITNKKVTNRAQDKIDIKHLTGK